MTKKKRAASPPRLNRVKTNLKKTFHRFKHLQGDPHFVAMGMAIGVFVAVTPTVPFHTILAIGLAIAFKASKPAAVLGVWFCNPLTIPFIYLSGYNFGIWLLGRELTPSLQTDAISQLLQMGFDVTFAALLGGTLLGLCLAFITYFITKYLITTIRHHMGEKNKAQRKTRSVI